MIESPPWLPTAKSVLRKERAVLFSATQVRMCVSAEAVCFIWTKIRAVMWCPSWAWVAIQ